MGGGTEAVDIVSKDYLCFYTVNVYNDCTIHSNILYVRVIDIYIKSMNILFSVHTYNKFLYINVFVIRFRT